MIDPPSYPQRWASQCLELYRYLLNCRVSEYFKTSPASRNKLIATPKWMLIIWKYRFFSRLPTDSNYFLRSDRKGNLVIITMTIY